MLYAKIVLGLPVEGPFDYIVPSDFAQKIKIGMRVWVPFRFKKMLGYVVKLTHKTEITSIKPLWEVIDDAPVLDKNMLLLTKGLSDYYCCSWGEAIESALPLALRKGKTLPLPLPLPQAGKNDDTKPNSDKRILCCKQSGPGQGPEDKITLIHDIGGFKRWEIYIQQIKETITNNKSVIILLPDTEAALKAKEKILSQFDCALGVLYRKERGESEEWMKTKEGKYSIVVGTRSAIFAPINNLGLIIIDEEHNSTYKQDQMPHYHPREVALMRINIEKAKLILGSASPSLESFYLAKKSKIRYIFIPQEKFPAEIKVIDIKGLLHFTKRKQIILSKYLEDAIFSVLNTKGKILLFLNRSGFATVVFCRHCDTVLKCARCNINLVYHFKDNVLKCHYCNFKMESPKICPNCNVGYIQYSGMGTEKIESEIARCFPQARIQRLDTHEHLDTKEADIFISTRHVLGETKYNFDLISVLAIDNSLNRVDFRAAEKTFALLVGLLAFTEKKIVIQTSLPNHHCFRALFNQNVGMFYDYELKQRRQLDFPPFKHLVLVKLRGQKESRVRDVSNALFQKLNKSHKSRMFKIISTGAGQPSRLRGNFYWQILIKGSPVYQITKFLKTHLKDFSHSGIIVTVDIDPL